MRIIASIVIGLMAICAWATPPYGDPNQPYDRLPGTLETEHVKWAKPLAGGKLNVLFIIPYCNSREVIETAQRLDLNYTVIMNAGNTVWEKGFYEGPTATPLKGMEATVVLENIARRRLSLGFEYDAIVIAKISWLAMPDYVRELILKHVERGAGLVYVSPNRMEANLARGESKISTKDDPQYKALFGENSDPNVGKTLLGSLPVDVMRLYALEKPGDYKEIPGIGRRFYEQASVYINVNQHGQGRVLGLDYFDVTVAGIYSLSPYMTYSHTDHDAVMYDYDLALLAKCILWSVGKDAGVKGGIAFQSPPTELKAPVDEAVAKRSWKYLTPATVLARDDLPKAKAVISAGMSAGKSGTVKLEVTLRDREGMELKKETIPVGIPAGKEEKREIGLPMLSRGTYLLDLRVLDQTGRVLDFASASFRVENAQQVKEVKTDKEAYKDSEQVTGTVTFAQPLGEKEKGEVWARDTWGRVVARAEVIPEGDRSKGKFAFPVHGALCRLWDIYGAIQDERGLVDSAKTWVGLPNWTFDDYVYMLIFAPTPMMGGGWKGSLYAKVMRQYGLNATFTYLLHNYLTQYECNDRYHLQSVSFAEHKGEAESHRKGLDPNKEETNTCLAEVSRMCRYIADTGKLMDPKEFTYKLPQGAWDMSAGWINGRVAGYQASAKFGTPFYSLAGEEYMLGEFRGEEYSGFSPLCTKKFQEWCQGQYANDLNALNAEWGSGFKSWDEVRGILLKDAVDKNQLPRWVDFRYFMRSRVWSQFFIDWSDMIRRFVPEARTGKLGHDHHDFTRYRDQMTCCKLYIGQDLNTEWREAIIPELYQSFTGDRTFLMASQSMIRWTYDLQTPINNERWPWKVLFLGLNGFDWERGLPESLGGEFCFTPDMSEPLPYFVNITREIKYLEQGIGKLTIAAKPVRSKVAMLWAPYNHYISRLLPFQENGFSGTWLYNISVIGGAPSDCVALLSSIRIRPTILAPEDLADNGLKKRGFKALFLPYNKGMSEMEAEAIRAFVKEDGLVIADNTPGIYSQHGKELKEPRLKDLFPSFDKKNIVQYGKGRAVYLPHEINGYMGRFEHGDYTGSESVAILLKEYAGETPPVELVNEKGLPRRDTLMPVFRKGSLKMVGLMRASTSEGQEPEGTMMELDRNYHVWNIRSQEYCGYTNRLAIRLDLRPQYYALMPVRPINMALTPGCATVKQGADLKLTGRVDMDQGERKEMEKLGQVVHVRVYSPKGEEMEWYRQNVVFEGNTFAVTLPVSYSEVPGRYTVEMEHALTGLKSMACFDVVAAGL